MQPGGMAPSLDELELALRAFRCACIHGPACMQAERSAHSITKDRQ